MLYRFNDLELDTDQMELRRAGGRVAVEPQVFAVLRLLVEQRTRLVTKDDLIAEVWDGRIVSDSALSSRIKSARQAIGDDGAAQRWIRTAHGQGFRFVGEVTEAGTPALPRSAAPARVADVMARPLVAVFPFEQADTDPLDDYFVEGLAEDLMAELAAWRWFPILSRNAAFDERLRLLPIAERAAALGARYAVTGRFHRIGERARLSVELIDVADGAQLWSARFDDSPGDLLGAQAEIAAQVFRRIVPELNSAERRRILRKPPADRSAWDMTLQALWSINRAGPTDFAKALEQLEIVTRLDPSASLPWSLISLVHYETALKGWVGGQVGGVRGHLRDMLDAAQRAVDIDPSGWMGHALASAGELWAASSHERARLHADQALDLNPSAGLAHQFSGCVYGFGGDPESAIEVQSQAFRIDPDYLHADVVESDLGLWTFLLGDFDASSAHLERSLAHNPTNLRARQRMVATRGAAGDRVGAEAAVAQLAALGGTLTPEYLTASYPFLDPDHTEAFRQGLRRAGVRLD